MIREALARARLPAARFEVVESRGRVDPARVGEVLRGETAGYLVHGFVSESDCKVIADNFWSSGHRTARYGEGEGGVEGHLVGASHIEKSTLDYLNEARGCAGAVESLYAGAVDPFTVFRDVLATTGAVSCVRPARFNGLPAGHSKAVCWNGVGPFLLEPHDDLAQLSDPRQAGFEIQRVTRVMAVNIYPQVPAGGGQIQIWNLAPDDASRDSLGLRYSGFPYPPELLHGVPSRIISVAAGDLCLVNGNLVHAVLRGEPPDPTGPKRLLLTCFMGVVDYDQLIWWT